MNSEVFFSLVNNLSLLLVLGFLYELMYPGFSSKPSRVRQFLIGGALGVIGMVIMMIPWEFTSGITFDTRSILLGISGLFFGTVPTLIAMFATGLLRIFQGGSGTLTGLLVICSSGSLGLLWRRAARTRPEALSLQGLYLLGILIHIVMLLLMFTLPLPVATSLLRVLTLPVLIIYPLGTALLGRLLHGRLQQNLLARQLQASRERMLVTLRSIGEGVITTDEQGNIQLINPVAEQLTGWKQRDAAGKPLVTVLHMVDEQTRQRYTDRYRRVIEHGVFDAPAELSIVRALDGSERLIAESCSPIRDTSGQIVGMVLVLRDQTEAKNMQERMQRNDKLESLGILAGGLAHDFNNLLGGIFGYIELAHEMSSEEPVQSFLSKAMGVFDRAKAITMQLLTFSKGGPQCRRVFASSRSYRRTPRSSSQEQTRPSSIISLMICCRAGVTRIRSHRSSTIWS